jgi:phage terminase small subunit
MGKRGPAPRGELTVVKFTENDKPNPPAGMSARSRNLFRKIVAENSNGAFADGEAVMLLKAFCEAEENHYEATKHIQKEGAVVTVTTRYGVVSRKSAWFDAQKESAGVMASMSAKLRAKRTELVGAKKEPKRVTGRKMFGQ